MLIVQFVLEHIGLFKEGKACSIFASGTSICIDNVLFTCNMPVEGPRPFYIKDKTHWS